MLEGLDVSRWQTTTPSLAGKSFLFARATYGSRPDAMFATHIANARAAGLLVGAYAFGVGDAPVDDQVNAFLTTAGTVDFYVLDLESNGGRPSMTVAQATAFIALVKARGRRIALYHSDSGYPSLGQSYNWVAKWSTTPPSRPFAFWQYRGSPLDLDRFDGDWAALKRLAGIAPAPPRYSLRFSGGAFWVYQVDGKPFTDSRGVKYGGTITGRYAKRFNGPTSAPCGAPMPFAWSGGTRRLVLVTAGALKGQHVAVPQSTVRMETT